MHFSRVYKPVNITEYHHYLLKCQVLMYEMLKLGVITDVQYVKVINSTRARTLIKTLPETHSRPP